MLVMPCNPKIGALSKIRSCLCDLSLSPSCPRLLDILSCGLPLFLPVCLHASKNQLGQGHVLHPTPAQVPCSLALPRGCPNAVSPLCPQIKGMKDRLEFWCTDVKSMEMLVEHQAHDILT